MSDVIFTDRMPLKYGYSSDFYIDADENENPPKRFYSILWAPPGHHEDLVTLQMVGQASSKDLSALIKRLEIEVEKLHGREIER